MRNGDRSAFEVVSAALAHIAQVDPDVRALVHVDSAHALDRAHKLDLRRSRGGRPGPLAGVPFVVKDNMDVRGQTTANGSHAHDGVVAIRNARVVTRVLDAGGILLGRANMDELAMGASTRSSAFGPTRNPLDLTRSPGGSSGGSAAAVAAGYVPLSLGTDTGGSIREPAAQCGIVGMAPSPGLVPTTGIVPFAPGLDRVGPLAADVTGAAALLEVLSGRTMRASTAQVRVGLVQELMGAPNQDGVLAALRRAADVLAALGIATVPVSVPDARRGLSAYMTITSAAVAPLLERYVRTGQAGTGGHPTVGARPRDHARRTHSAMRTTSGSGCARRPARRSSSAMCCSRRRCRPQRRRWRVSASTTRWPRRTPTAGP